MPSRSQPPVQSSAAESRELGPASRPLNLSLERRATFDKPASPAAPQMASLAPEVGRAHTPLGEGRPTQWAPRAPRCPLSRSAAGRCLLAPNINVYKFDRFLPTAAGVWLGKSQQVSRRQASAANGSQIQSRCIALWPPPLLACKLSLAPQCAGRIY